MFRRLHRHTRRLRVLDHLWLGRHRRSIYTQLAGSHFRETPGDGVQARDILVPDLLRRLLDNRLEYSIRAHFFIEFLQFLRGQRLASFNHIRARGGIALHGGVARGGRDSGCSAG